MKEDNNQGIDPGIYIIYVIAFGTFIYTSTNSLLNWDLSILEKVLYWFMLIVGIITFIRITYLRFRK